MCTSAGTRTGQDACQVARTVAYQWHHFTVEGSQHQFANFAIGHRFACFGIDNFYQVAVFPKVHTVLLGTLEGYARTVHFRHTKTVVGLYTQHAFYFLALFVGMRLRTNDKGFQACLGGIHAFFLEHFGQTDGIAGDGVQGSCLEVCNELDLTFAVSCSGRHCQRS